MHLAGGVDHPITKPVHKDFYTKIINFFIFSKHLRAENESYMTFSLLGH